MPSDSPSLAVPTQEPVSLPKYVKLCTSRSACCCGRCVVSGGDAPAAGKSVSVAFFDVHLACDGGVMAPSADELRRLVSQFKGEFRSLNPLDGEEHNFIDLGGWLGSQELALRFIGLSHLLGIARALTPDLIPGLDAQLKMELAQAGMVSMQAVSP